VPPARRILAITHDPIVPIGPTSQKAFAVMTR
jgi:hypothetical protein